MQQHITHCSFLSNTYQQSSNGSRFFFRNTKLPRQEQELHLDSYGRERVFHLGKEYATISTESGDA